MTAQATFLDTVRVGIGAKCSSELYDGAPKGSCTASMRGGLRF